jgi:hypothetical protein
LVNTVIAIGAVIVVFGAIGMLLPAVFRSLINAFRSQAMLAVASVVRVAVGIVLLLAAPQCRFTTAVQVFGVIAILAGVALPLLGTERANRLFDWFARQSDTAARAWAVVAILIGVFLLIAAL